MNTSIKLNDSQREILLCVENDGDIYERCTDGLLQNYARKVVKGTFDVNKAVKGLVRPVEMEMKKYNRMYGGSDSKWFSLLTVQERKEVAYELLLGYLEDINDRANELKSNK